jgi:hypothetical protein
MGLTWYPPKWGFIWDNSPLFWGEYYSDTPFMLSPISPGSPNVSYTMLHRLASPAHCVTRNATWLAGVWECTWADEWVSE